MNKMMRSIEIKQRASRELVRFICFEMDMLNCSEIQSDNKELLPMGWTLKMSADRLDFDVNGKASKDLSLDELCLISDLVEGLYTNNDFRVNEGVLIVK